MSNLSLNDAMQIIKQVRYATIATADRNGQPWNTPVAIFHDDDLCFYWASNKDSQHSKNIVESGNAFLVIYNSTVPSEQARGVYIKAHVTQVEDLETADQVVAQFGNDPYLPSEGSKYLDSYRRRIYKAEPLKMWMNDGEGEGADYIDVRREIQLK